MATLFAPFRLREIELKDPIVVSPMCEYSAVDGHPQTWHLVHLGSRAVRGAALVFTEATAVEARGRISPTGTGLYLDSHIGSWPPIVDLTSSLSIGCAQLSSPRRRGASSPGPTFKPSHVQRSNVRLSPLECALTSKHRVLLGFGRSCPPATPLESAFTEIPSVNPLECAFTKKVGGDESVWQLVLVRKMSRSSIMLMARCCGSGSQKSSCHTDSGPLGFPQAPC
jgi:hypothetical protein